MMFTLVDGGDQPPFGSAVSAWGWMSSDASAGIFAVAFLLAVLGWVGALITAVIGVVESRRTRR